MRWQRWWKIGLAAGLCLGLGLAAGEGAAQEMARFDALMAEVEADLAKAPEVDRDAEYYGAIGPSEAGWKIADRLAEAGYFERATKISEGIAVPGYQARAIREVVLAHLEREDLDPVKRLEDAKEVLAKIPKVAAIVAELLTELAGWVALHGEKETALETFALAEGWAALVDDTNQKGKLVFFIVISYLELDETERARALADQIEDKFWRAGGQKSVALSLAKAGDFAGAEELAATIDDEEVADRDEAYAWLVEYLTTAGQWDEARRVIDRIDKGANQVRVLAEVITKQAEGDEAKTKVDFSEAKVLASGFVDPLERAQALFALVEVYLKAGQFDEAEATALGIVDPDRKAQAFAALTLYLVEAGRFDDAEAFAVRLISNGANARLVTRHLLDVAKSFWESDQKTLAIFYLAEAERISALIVPTESRSDDETADRLAYVAEIYIEFGKVSEAERVATGIQDPTQRIFAFTDVAVAHAKDGQIAEVLRQVAEIAEIQESLFLRGKGLADIAKALAVTGEIAAAEAVVEAIVEPSLRAEALGEITITLADRGHLSEAERIARRIEDPAWRAVALGAVAAGL